MYYKQNRNEFLTFCENPGMLQILKQLEMALPAGDSSLSALKTICAEIIGTHSENTIFQITDIF